MDYFCGIGTYLIITLFFFYLFSSLPVVYFTTIMATVGGIAGYIACEVKEALNDKD